VNKLLSPRNMGIGGASVAIILMQFIFFGMLLDAMSDIILMALVYWAGRMDASN